MSNEWGLLTTLNVKGKETYNLKSAPDELACYELAKAEWVKFYQIKEQPKHLITIMSNKDKTIKKEVECDAVGHCKIIVRHP